MTGVISVSLDLAWFDKLVECDPPPHGMTLTIFDHNGSIAYNYPEMELAGKSMAGNKIYNRAVGGRSGNIETVGPDGIKRVFYYGPLDSQSGGLFIAFGAERSTMLNLIIDVITPRNPYLTGVTLIFVLLVWADVYFLVWHIRKIKGK